jgi:hypothetical protein
VAVVDAERTAMHKACFVSLQRLHVVAIPKIAYVQDETDVRPASSGMDVSGYHEVFRGPSGGIAASASPRISFCSCNFGPTLAGYRRVRGRLAFTCAVSGTLLVSRRTCSSRRNTLPSR